MPRHSSDAAVLSTLFGGPYIHRPAEDLAFSVARSKSGDCAAFLSNLDSTSWTKLTFQNVQYDLLPWSISILPDCRTEVYNTAKVRPRGLKRKMLPVIGKLSWQLYSEPIPSDYDKDTFEKQVNISSGEGFLISGKWPHRTVMSAGHVLHIFINDMLSGTVYGNVDNPEVTYNGYVKLRAGINKISLLSVAVGLRIGLKGESSNLGTGNSSVKWAKGSYLAQKRPLTWYKTTFNAPEGNDPLAIDMFSMGKGEIWINGESIGRHWAGYIAKGNCRL
ncbi:hypothetical protein BUALT_Bualt16G0052400 [Buddleja alternifolia]|uniref:Beta-galactosidase n=1 Tax=Buddleja alternifolia TaxID=168488 RepID=A0AAV6W9E1_9LAMI|nr:hypothetical protein BUALT_Bualt16G0052400 [Buddleja alternifolia]